MTNNAPAPGRREEIYLAGGCFWGVQDIIRAIPGVIETDVGYTGGLVENATYRRHDGHAEAVRVVFDPDRLPFEEFLRWFFRMHDPTTKDRQGNDIGSSYRSAIFYKTDEQRRIAEEFVRQLDANGDWGAPIVTEIVAAGDYWLAEPEHQDYLEKSPGGYTCHFLRPESVLGPDLVPRSGGATGGG
jgi:peptide-methionine (S)-S-oxide reductase